MSDEVTRYVDSDGNVSYYNKANQLHRLDGPAVEYVDGSKEWWQNGQLHRLDGPAREYSAVPKEWYKSGKLHRLDGPAVEHSDGYKAWYIEGKQYRSEKEWEKARCPSIETLKEMFKEVRHE
jgi:hypothetical protein